MGNPTKPSDTAILLSNRWVRVRWKANTEYSIGVVAEDRMGALACAVSVHLPTRAKSLEQFRLAIADVATLLETGKRRFAGRLATVLVAGNFNVELFTHMGNVGPRGTVGGAPRC